jgi:hypothetical protein
MKIILTRENEELIDNIFQLFQLSALEVEGKIHTNKSKK